MNKLTAIKKFFNLDRIDYYCDRSGSNQSMDIIEPASPKNFDPDGHNIFELENLALKQYNIYFSELAQDNISNGYLDLVSIILKSLNKKNSEHFNVKCVLKSRHIELISTDVYNKLLYSEINESGVSYYDYFSNYFCEIPNKENSTINIQMVANKIAEVAYRTALYYFSNSNNISESEIFNYNVDLSDKDNHDYEYIIKTYIKKAHLIMFNNIL